MTRLGTLACACDELTVECMDVELYVWCVLYAGINSSGVNLSEGHGAC